MAAISRFFGDRGRRRAATLGIDPERLPPGQSPTVKWPVLQVGPVPRVDRERWLQSVDGIVEEPYVLDWRASLELPQTEWTGDIHCVTRWSKFDMHWRGVSTASLIERARPRADASHLLAHSYDAYTTNLPLDESRNPQR
jgi:DMSO/TMAO reductase YedYZ molybdopterin-dependent catalytic subunit